MASQHPVPVDAHVARVVARLDADRREAFEERAGILEFDARFSREDAERRALVEVLARQGFPSEPPVRLLQADVGEATEWLLTGDAVTARRALADLGVTRVVEVDLAETVQRQFAGLAALATFP